MPDAASLAQCVPRPARRVRLPLTARRHPLVARVGRRLRLACDRSPRERLVVAVSGGADSSALLLACSVLHGRRAERRSAPDPVAAHVHHHLRADADADAQWVAGLCERLGLELRVEHVRPGEQPGNLPANARRDRYEALGRIAQSVRATGVAVAHHAEDQFETILMALGRGAGLDGLGGMAWSRPLVGQVRLLRPLLDSHRAECEDLCRAAGIEWREDPTNQSLDAARARVRREVLPVFEDLWPGAAGRIAGTAETLRAARAALERIIEDVFGQAQQTTWDRSKLADAGAPIIASGLRRSVLAIAPDLADTVGQGHLKEAAALICDEERRPRSLDWAGGLRLVVTAKLVEIERVDSTEDQGQADRA